MSLTKTSLGAVIPFEVWFASSGLKPLSYVHALLTQARYRDRVGAVPTPLLIGDGVYVLASEVEACAAANAVAVLAASATLQAVEVGDAA